MSRRTKIIAAVAVLVVIGGIVAFFALRASGGGPEVETADGDASRSSPSR